VPANFCNIDSDRPSSLTSSSNSRSLIV